mgnify:CR=1 FL=1
MKKSIMITLLLIVLLVTACSPAAPAETEEPAEQTTEETGSEETPADNGGTMMFAIGSDPTIVNPLYADDRVSLTIARPLFEELYTVSGSDIHYILAESMTPSEDFLSYTLVLKEGIKWHDGQPLTADDVIFTLETVLDESQAAKYRSSLIQNGQPISFSKVDDRTVEFKLAEVSIPFLNSISAIRPIPKHIFEGSDVGQNSANQSPIGTGPFKFAEHKSGETYTLVRNEEYHGETAQLDSVVYRVIPDANAQLVALENGEIHAAYIKSNSFDRFNNNENFNLYTFDEGMVSNIFMRVNNPALEDIRVRQAIAYAIDKQILLDGAFGGDSFARPAYSPFSSNTAYYTEDVEKYDFDLEKAKQLMAEAGVEDLTLRFMYTATNTDQEKEAVLVQEMLREIGITVELMPLERATFIEKLLDKSNMDFELAANGYVMGTHPNGYMSLFRSDSASNFSGYFNPEVDRLFDEAAKETDDALREEMYNEIQRIVSEDVVQYSIANSNSIVAVAKEFKGIEQAMPAPIHMFNFMNKIYK